MHASQSINPSSQSSSPIHSATLARLFGIATFHRRRPRIRRRVPVVPGRITLILGDSGSGKSTLLRQIARRLRAAGWRLFDPASIELDPHRPVIDTFSSLPLDAALAILSRAGLAEAAALLRPATQLSEG